MNIAERRCLFIFGESYDGTLRRAKLESAAILREPCGFGATDVNDLLSKRIATCTLVTLPASDILPQFADENLFGSSSVASFLNIAAFVVPPRLVAEICRLRRKFFLGLRPFGLRGSATEKPS